MIIGAIDQATTTGFCVFDGQTFRASSFKPNSKRNPLVSRGDIDPHHNARVVMQFREHFRAWLVAEQIEHVAIEDLLRPSPPRLKKTKRPDMIGGKTEVIENEIIGGSNFTALALSCALFSAATEICTRLNIPFVVVRADTWRKSFLGLSRAPRDAKDSRAWLKKRARQQCDLLKIKVSNDDQGDAVGLCWHLRGMLESKNRPDLFGGVI